MNNNGKPSIFNWILIDFSRSTISNCVDKICLIPDANPK
jgi:hypothetical protein